MLDSQTQQHETSTNGAAATPVAVAISVQTLSKTYKVPEREPGLGQALRSFFKRRYRDVEAVKEVSFAINSGEGVGFLGPNGVLQVRHFKVHVADDGFGMDRFFRHGGGPQVGWSTCWRSHPSMAASLTWWTIGYS